VLQQRTTAALWARIHEDPGATRWIQTRDGRSATFRAVLVSVL